MKIKFLIYVLVLATILPLGALAGYLIVSWHDDSRVKAIEIVEGLASAAADNLRQRVVDTEAMLGLIARRPLVRDLNPASCDDGMRILRETDPVRANVTVIDSVGAPVCAVIVPSDGSSPSMADTEWFQRVMTENRFVVSKPYMGRLTGLLVAVMAYPIRADDGAPIGVVTMPHELVQLRPALSRTELAENTAFTVVDGDGVVIAHQADSSWIGRKIDTDPIVQVALSRPSGAGTGVTIDGAEMVFGYKTIPVADWTAIVSQPIDSVFAETRAISIWATSIVGIVLVVVFLVAAFLARRIARPIAQIAATARAIADGETETRMQVPQLDEFATVARQFNAMLDVRRESERRVQKLNRMYLALSETNQAITKIADRAELLKAVCGIAVQCGGFKLAWIGFIDSSTRMVVPEASVGEAIGYMNGLRVSIDPDDPIGRGPTARAIRGGQPEVISDVSRDENSRPWREAASHYGFRATGAFPLAQDGNPVGSINLYATEVDYFEDPELMALIGEMANDLSFALDAIRGTTDRRDTEERFRQIAENIKEVFWLTDPTKNNVLYVSPAYGEIWGRTVEDLYESPRTWIDAIHPQDRARVSDAATTKQISGDYDEEYRIVRPDEEIRWIHDRAFPIRDATGAVYRVAGIAEDITERKRMEDAVHRSEASLAAAQAIAKIGNWDRDLISGRAYWSEEMYRLFDRARDMGPPGLEKLLVFFDPADRDKMIEADAWVRRTGTEISVELRSNTIRGAVRRLRVTITPVKNPAGTVVGLAGTVQDVTDIREAEARLFQVQKMEALGTFAGGIAHDFNNMLSPILNLSERIKKEIPVDHSAQKYLAIVIDAAVQARELVSQILSFSRRGDRDPIVLDIADCIEGAVRLLDNALPSGIALVALIDGDTGLVEADPTELQSVILNLGSNAAYAMREAGGTLTIGVSRVGTDADFADRYPNLAPHAQFVRIAVADTGHGMDEATIKEIFAPFFTTKPAGEGSGFGLPTVHGIVEGLGGVIDVTSSVGVGTTFAIYLPLLEDNLG